MNAPAPTISPVLGPTVVTPPQPEQQVLGAQVTRTVGRQLPRTVEGQLPRTGGDLAAGLAPFGLLLLAAGFALQRSGRRMSDVR